MDDKNNNNQKLSTVDRLARIDVKLDQLIKHYSRMIFAMLGIIAATVGVKFIGSPPYVIIATYMAWFGSVFVLTSVVYKWRDLHWTARALRLSMGCLVLFSVLVRTIVYQVGIEAAPVWYSPAIDCFYIVVCTVMVLRVWKKPTAKEDE